MRAILLLIILMRSADNSAIEERHNEQKLLLRKLLSLQQNNSTEKHSMWNEILANAFVNKIKTIFAKQPENGIEEPDVITKCVGGVMKLFKKFYWDAHKNPAKEDENNNNVDIEIGDPKDEVETVEPKYHGRLLNATEDFNVDGRTMCPVGSMSDGKGNCVDPNNQKYIMAIPYLQCPPGYLRDRIGRCRPLF